MAEINVQRLQPYEAPFSTWQLIKSIVSKEELPLIRSYLGESFIEICVDLRTELEMLLEIWKEIGEQTVPPTVAKSITNSFLSEPQNMREILTKEIKMLLEGINEKNELTNTDKFTETEKSVMKYAMHQNAPMDSDRSSTPLRKLNVEQEYKTSPVKLKQIRRNINATDIDKVVDILRDAIKKESQALEHDIEFLQKCLEEEHEISSSRPTSPVQEPSIYKLKQVRNTLESRAFKQERSQTKTKETHHYKAPHSPTYRPKIPTSPLRGNSLMSPFKVPTPPASGQKLSTPPSPSKVKLAPLERNNRPASSIGFTYPSVHVNPFERPSTNLGYTNEPFECWIEPVWAKQMSDSMPNTPDSGVGSRPATCDLSTIQEKMKILEKSQNFAPEQCSRFQSSPQPAKQTDNGYHTSSSISLSDEFSTVDIGNRNKEAKIKCPISNKQKPHIKQTNIVKFTPRPPPRMVATKSAHRPSRQVINNIRHHRKDLGRQVES